MPSSAYRAYELTPGGCLEQVESICKHLTDAGSFTGSATIEVTDLEVFISACYYEMGAWLAEFRYSATQTSEAVLGLLQHYNAIGAAARAELSVNAAGFSPNENSRFHFLWKQYHDGFREILAGGGLGNIGATELSSDAAGGLTAGGISVSDKETIEKDADATGYSFTRKHLDNPQSGRTRSDSTTKELP